MGWTLDRCIQRTQVPNVSCSARESRKFRWTDVTACLTVSSMGQRAQTTVDGREHVTRLGARIRDMQTVRRIGRQRSFRQRWREPIVIYVIDGGDAWSAYLKRMTRRPGWSVARLARESNVARSTIFRWIAKGAEAVTIESVHRIADALGDDRANALKAAGNLPPERDEEVDLILNAPWSEARKVQAIDRLMRRREEERERRMADLRFMLGEEEAG